MRITDLLPPRESLENAAPRVAPPVPRPRVVVRREGRMWVLGSDGEGALRDVMLIRPVRPLSNDETQA